MPATAGRVRMPANNRVHSSAALQTHGIWQSAIGYDPYAPNKEDKKDSSQNLPNAEPDAENAYASFQGLLQLAKITNADVDVSRGACKKCGRVGHLKFQCKNYVKIKDDKVEKDPEAMQPLGLVGMDKLKGKAEKVDKRSNVESSEEEEDSESSDSEVDSEIERIIAERSGKKVSGKGGSYRKKGDSDDDGSDKDSGKKRKKRGRSKKRSSKREVSDSDDSGERRRRRKKRREHRRKRDKSLDDSDEYRHRKRKSRKEKRRRRSRLSDSDSESSEDSTIRHKRKSKRTSSTDTDSSGYDDSRMGRDIMKSDKRRRRHHGDDE